MMMVVLLVASAWPFLIPISIAFYMSWLCWTRGGDPQRDSTTVQYEPPENLTPAECGALLHNEVAVRGITATVVDLSLKGYLLIERNGDGELRGPRDNQDYVFHLIKPSEDWSNLKPHERAVLRAIFIPTNPLRMLSEAMSELQSAAKNPVVGAALSGVTAMAKANPALRVLSEARGAARFTVTLLEVQTHFNLHLASINSCIFKELVLGGYYSQRPDQVRLLYLAKGVVIGLLVALVGGLLTFVGNSRIDWIWSGVFTAVAILGFGWLMPARSIKGARTLAKVLGFADFLGRVDKDHIERLQTTPQLFEKYLPYAMALGVEKKWAQAFARITVPAPQWYRGSGSDFFPADLVNSVNNAMPNKQGA